MTATDHQPAPAMRTPVPAVKGSGARPACCGYHRPRCLFGRPHVWATWYEQGKLQRTADTFSCPACGGVCVAGEAPNAQALAAHLGALHGAAGLRPYGDPGGDGEGLLLGALGETGPATPEDTLRRLVLLSTYQAAYSTPDPARWRYGITYAGKVAARFPIAHAALDALGSYDAGSVAVCFDGAEEQAASAGQVRALTGQPGRGPGDRTARRPKDSGQLAPARSTLDEVPAAAWLARVWVVEHVNWHGTVITAHADEAGALAAAAAVARDGWDNITGHDGVPDSPDGLDDAEAVQLYFANRPDEEHYIHAADVEGVPGGRDLAGLPLQVRAPEIADLVAQLPPGPWGPAETAVLAAWLAEHGYRGGGEPGGGEASGPGEYEGYVRFADGTVVSLQCYEGRCRECPDGNPAGDECEGTGPLEGWYCERGVCGAGA